jgi:endonuclease/exonuclease/phosphatase family metal-dependent hydrolase
LLERALRDSLDWAEQPTWPVDAHEWAEAWKRKLGEQPDRDPEPRRLDYLLTRGVEIADSGTIALCADGRSASDHHLVWADVS